MKTKLQTNLIYGEAWNFGSLLDNIEQYTFHNITIPFNYTPIVNNLINLDEICWYFDDKYRDNILGSIFEDNLGGLIGGKGNWELYCNNFSRINYITCHDNNTLLDMILLKCSDKSLKENIEIYHLVIGMLLLTFRPILIQAGTETLRSKNFDFNSYNTGYLYNNIGTIKKDLLPLNIKNLEGVNKVISTNIANEQINLTNEIFRRYAILRKLILSKNPFLEKMEIHQVDCISMIFSLNNNEKAIIFINLGEEKKLELLEISNLNEYYKYDIPNVFSEIENNKFKIGKYMSVFLNA